MQAYHDELIKYLLDADILDVEKYSYHALLDDYRRGALFGFTLASFYFPELLGKINDAVLKYDSMEPLEFAKYLKQTGGDEISKILADMLLELRDLGCLKHVL